MQKPAHPVTALPRRIASLAFRGLLFTLLLAVTLEICARIDDALRYGAPFLGSYSNERLRGKDPLGFTCNLPNARFEKWQHNSLGFRGPEVAREKKGGVTRVVCLGASESYGLYESPGKEWPAQLDELLPNSQYEVVNASVVGLSLTSFEAYLQKHVFPLHPDIVVLVVNPLFYVTGQSKAEQKGGHPPPAPAAAPPRSLKESLAANLRIFPKLKQVVKQAISDNFPDPFRRYQIAQTRKQVEEIERMRLRGRTAMEAVPESYLENFGRGLQRTVELIRSRNCEVVLTSYPALISGENLARHQEIFLDNRRFCIELSLTGIVDTFRRFNSVTAEVAGRMRAPFVDTHRFMPKSTEFFGDNVHYTDQGARVFAQSVSTLLTGRLHPRQARQEERR